MSRLFLDDVRSDIVTQLQPAANTTGPELSALLINLIDSSIQDECGITGDVLTPFATTVAWQSIAVGFTTDIGGDGDFLKPNFATGEIITSVTAGFTYEIELFASFEDLANGQRVDFSVLENGVPVGFLSANQGEGNDDPVTATAKQIEISASSNAVYTIGIRTPQGANNLDILSLALVVTIQPTNNP